MTFDQFALALAETESHGDRFAWGDDGLAAGQWQQHPAFTFQWFDMAELKVRSSWNDVFYVALRVFFNEHTTNGVSCEQIALIFHLGEQGVAQGVTDPDYLARFRAAVAALVTP